MPKAAGMQLLLQFRNSPGAVALRARGLLTTTRCDEPALSIDQFGNLSIDSGINEQIDFLGQKLRNFADNVAAEEIDKRVTFRRAQDET
jgi:hypothetical protein